MALVDKSTCAAQALSVYGDAGHCPAHCKQQAACQAKPRNDLIFASRRRRQLFLSFTDVLFKKSRCCSEVAQDCKMGNLCSKSSNEPENFSSPGRTLGSAPPNAPTSAAVPPQVTKNTPGRTLGGGGNSPDNARGAAAQAAEVRPSKLFCKNPAEVVKTRPKSTVRNSSRCKDEVSLPTSQCSITCMRVQSIVLLNTCTKVTFKPQSTTQY